MSPALRKAVVATVRLPGAGVGLENIGMGFTAIKLLDVTVKTEKKVERRPMDRCMGVVKGQGVLPESEAVQFRDRELVLCVHCLAPVAYVPSSVTPIKS
jgi:hypothetical protein